MARASLLLQSGGLNAKPRVMTPWENQRPSLVPSNQSFRTGLQTRQGNLSSKLLYPKSRVRQVSDEWDTMFMDLGEPPVCFRALRSPLPSSRPACLGVRTAAPATVQVGAPLERSHRQRVHLHHPLEATNHCRSSQSRSHSCSERRWFVDGRTSLMQGSAHINRNTVTTVHGALHHTPSSSAATDKRVMNLLAPRSQATVQWACTASHRCACRAPVPWGA